MKSRTCAAAKCAKRFEPYCIDQIYCSDRCRTRMNVRALRDRRKHGGDPDGGGRQRRLFPKLLKTKPPQSAPRVPEPTLFETEMRATYGGSVEYGKDGSQRPISTIRSLTLNRTNRKPSTSVPLTTGGQHAA
jgi:hypothetical protein